MLTRYVKGNFPDGECASTMGIDQMRKKIQVGKKTLDIEIFDTAGQERFRTITTAYYKSARAFLMVYDIGDEETFLGIAEWIKQIDLYANRKHARILIGNKLDAGTRKVDRARAEDFARDHNCNFFEISAKTGENVDKLFEKVVEELIQMTKKNASRKSGSKSGGKGSRKRQEENSEGGGCCVLQ